MAEVKDEWDEPVITPTVLNGDADEWAAPIGTTTASAPAASGIGAQVLRKTGIAANSLATGTAGALDIAGDVSDLINYATGADKFKPKNALERGLQTAYDITAHPGRSINKALGIGMENKDYGKLTPAEGYISATSSAVPNALAIAGTGGTGLLPALAIAESGGIAAEAAHQLQPKNKWLPAVAGVVASLGAGGLVGIVEKGLNAWRATKALTAAETRLGQADDALTAAQDSAFSGRDPRLAPGRSKEANALEIAQDTAFNAKHDSAKAAEAVKHASNETYIAKQQMAQTAVQEAEKAGAGQTEEVAKTFGKAVTPQEAGEAAQSSARNWYEKIFDKKIEEAKKPLKTVLEQKPSTELGNYEGTLNSILEKAPSLQASLDELTSSLPQSLKSALRPEAAKDAALAELGGVENTAATVAKSVPVTDAMKLRSALGNLMKNPTLLKDTDPTHIDALYAALTKDIGASMERAGAGEAWKAYNAESTRLYQFAGNVVSKLIDSGKAGQGSILPGKAVRSILTTAADDGTELALLRAEMPEAADAIAAYAIRNPGTFAGLSPEAKLALVPDVVKRQNLEVAGGLKSQAEANSARTVAQAEADHRAIVDATEAGVKEGNFSRLKAVREAQKAKQTADAEAYNAQRKAAYEASARVRAASKEVKSAKKEVKTAAAAKNAAQPPVNPITQAVESVKRLASGGAGFYVSPQILNALGLGSLGPMGQLGIAGAAMAVPSLVRGAKSLIKQPGKAMIPVTGVMAGNNALAPGRAKE